MTLAARQFFSSPADALPHTVEDAFFSSLKNPNKTFKCTWTRRFDQIDQWLVGVVKGRGAEVRELLDVGVSSGATTLDLYDVFSRAGFSPKITATDYALNAWIIPLGKRCAALLSEEGALLQMDLFGRSIQPWRRRLDFLTGMWLARPILSRLMERMATRKLRKGVGVSKVELVSPRVRDHRAINLIEDNVLIRRDSLIGRFDLVRAANVLNENYFAAADLRKAVENLRAYLNGAGSLLFIVRTLPGGEHHGTLFALRECGDLEVIDRVGDGSEIEKLLTWD